MRQGLHGYQVRVHMARIGITPRLTSRKSIYTGLAVASSVLLAGCGGCGLPIDDETGAEMVVDDTVEAGKPFDVAVYGQVGGGDTCASRLQISYEDTKVPDLSGVSGSELDRIVAQDSADTGQRLTEDSPQSAGTPCRLVAKRRQMTVLARGSEARQVKLCSTLQISATDRIRRSKVCEVVTVNPPGVPPQAPASHTPPPPPGTGPSSPASPGPGGSHGPGGRIVVSREPIVEDDFVYLYGNASHPSSGASITKYEWDLNGNGQFGDPEDEEGDYVFYTQPDNTAGTDKTFRLRVTDSAGAKAVVAKTVDVVAADETVIAYPVWPHDVTVGESHAIEPQSGGFDTAANSADLDWEDDGVIDEEMDEPPANIDTDSFPALTYTVAGTQVQRIRYSLSVGSLNKVANYYIVTDVAPAPHAQVAATGRPFSLSLGSGSAKVRNRGKLRVVDGGFRLSGTRVAGRFRGRVPRGTPKSLRPAFRMLASGRYVATLRGTANLIGDRVLASGRATVLVRSSKSRRTRICLSVRQPAGGGQGVVRLIGATGKARGLRGRGQTPPALLGPSGQPVFDRVFVRAHRGKPKGLNRTCRALARDLGGKRRKRR